MQSDLGNEWFGPEKKLSTKISKGSAIQNSCRGVSDLKKNPEERAMPFVGSDSITERLSIFKWG